MSSLITYVKALLAESKRNQRGVTVIEYALMLFLITVAVIATLTPIRDQVVAIFTYVYNALVTAR